MSSFHEEMRESFGGEKQPNQKYGVTKREEALFITGKILSLTFTSLVFYFSSAFVFSISDGFTWNEVKDKVLILTFVVFAITAVIVALRAYLGCGMMMYEGFRVMFKNQRLTESRIDYIRSMLFGFKLDTIMFYGSAIVFGITYMLL